jgi:hypothetical protein
VAKLSAEELRRLAKLGAAARLEQLRAEEAAIRAAFPDLTGRGPRGRRAGAAAVAPLSAASGRRRRPAMTAAGRKAVSERMRKYWAERRKTKTAAKAAK